MAQETGWRRIVLSKPLSADTLIINKSKTPKSRGSVGRNISKASPGKISLKDKDTGVKKRGGFF